MWFLDTGIFSRMVVACIVLMLTSIVSTKVFGKNVMKHLLLPIDLLLIGFVSWKLCLFYACYTLITYGFTLILKHAKAMRKTLFVLLCLACTLPFFYVRLTGFFDVLPKIFVLVGFSYNMLKAVDALYYTYYTQTGLSLYTYANYILFFPTVTSGPIFRYRDFDATFACPKNVDGELCEECIKKVIRGFFKKMVAMGVVSFVLDRVMYTLVDGEKVLNEFTLLTTLFVIALSYMTLYFDLSGYSDIAIGLGRIVGINVPENFKKPWLSPSFTVFWRNWHVTLSDFIREHIFVVLNGKKLNKFVSGVIGFVTMLVMSLWHGFTMPFVVSGVYNGLLLAIENIFGITKADKRKNKAVFYLRCVIVSLLFGINSMIFIFDFDTILNVLSGFTSNVSVTALTIICVLAVTVLFHLAFKSEKATRALTSVSFVAIFAAVFFAVDTYITYNNPFVGNQMFVPNDFEITQHKHPEKVWDKVLYGNSVVISGYVEEASKSGYVNLGVDCGQLCDLEKMLEKGHVKVGSELAIGINYLTLYDEFETNPSYIWHKKWYQPAAYFHRDKIISAFDAIMERMDADHPYPFTGYYKYPLEKAVYFGNLPPDKLAEKEAVYEERYYNLDDSKFDKNIKSLGEIVKFCEKKNIELFVFWMPWNPDAKYPELCDRLKARVGDVLEGTDVEVYDLTDRLEVKYFHDTGHIEYETGAPVFTAVFDELVNTWHAENK